MSVIYTDGSCIDKYGGWAWFLKNEDIGVYGNELNTTNNRMELYAVIDALTSIKDENNEYIIYSDSQLTINCAIGKWNRKCNIDLWNMYDNISKDKKITFNWVKAHNGDFYNELVDTYAKNSANKLHKSVLNNTHNTHSYTNI
jgi:ribonuclease HI